VNTYNYDVFGAIRSSTGTQANAFKFTGEQVDGSTGLQYLRARYYDMATGRFVSKDPLAGTSTFPLSQNRYNYVINSPLNLVDPSGLHCSLRHLFKHPQDCVKDSTHCDTVCQARICTAIERSGGGKGDCGSGRLQHGRDGTDTVFCYDYGSRRSGPNEPPSFNSWCGKYYDCFPNCPPDRPGTILDACPGLFIPTSREPCPLPKPDAANTPVVLFPPRSPLDEPGKE